MKTKVDFLKEQKQLYVDEFNKIDSEYVDNSDIEAKVEAYRNELLAEKSKNKEEKTSQLKANIDLLDDLIAKACELEEEETKEVEEVAEPVEEENTAETEEETNEEQATAPYSPFTVIR